MHSDDIYVQVNSDLVKCINSSIKSVKTVKKRNETVKRIKIN